LNTKAEVAKDYNNKHNNNITYTLFTTKLNGYKHEQHEPLL